MRVESAICLKCAARAQATSEGEEDDEVRTM